MHQHQHQPFYYPFECGANHQIMRNFNAGMVDAANASARLSASHHAALCGYRRLFFDCLFTVSGGQGRSAGLTPGVAEQRLMIFMRFTGWGMQLAWPT